MSQSMDKIGLFWSGKLGGQAARLHEKMLRAAFPGREVFISTNIVPGDQWFPRIHDEIRDTGVGLFFLAPDSLESPWIGYECGQLAAGRGLTAIVPVRVGVSQLLADARVPVLQPHNASEFGSQGSFRSLCLTCAGQLKDPRSVADIAAAADIAWSSHSTEISALLASVARVLPNAYRGVVKHSTLAHSNFNMPGLFQLIDHEIFLVGINHAYVLNVRRTPTVFIALVKWLLEPHSSRRARFLISDMWNPAVFECYRKLIHDGFAQNELSSFTECFKTPDSHDDVESVLRRNFREEEVARVIDEGLLEIRTFPTILDTFWFVDKGNGQGRCQLSPANALDGGNRPFFFCGEDDGADIFNYYYSLAENAFAGAARLWPRV